MVCNILINRTGCTYEPFSFTYLIHAHSFFLSGKGTNCGFVVERGELEDQLSTNCSVKVLCDPLHNVAQ